MKTQIKLSEFAAVAVFRSSDETCYVLNSVCVEFKAGQKPVIVATDETCLGAVYISENVCSENEQLIIPARHVVEIISLCKLKRVGSFTIHKSGFYLTVQISDPIGKNLCVLRFKPIDGTFPNWRQVVTADSKPTQTIAISPKILDRVIRAEKILCNGGGLTFTFNDNLSAIKITAKHPSFLCVVMPMRL